MTIPPHLTPAEALNALKDRGVISDNCLSLDDVAWADIPAAELFLSQYVKQALDTSIAQ